MNEVRNELIIIKNLVKAENKKDKELYLKWLLERFENDLKDQLKQIQYKEEEIQNNIELLKNIKEELKIK